MRYDLRGKQWFKVRKKRTPGYPPKSDNPLQAKETIAIGLAAGKPAYAFKASSAVKG